MNRFNKLKHVAWCLLFLLLLGACDGVYRVAVLEPMLVGVDTESEGRIRAAFKTAVDNLMQEDLKRSQVTTEPRHLKGVTRLPADLSARAGKLFAARRYGELQKLFAAKPLAEGKFDVVFMVDVSPALRKGYFVVENRLMNLETGGVYTFLPGDEGLVVPLASLVDDGYWKFELRRLYNKMIGK